MRLLGGDGDWRFYETVGGLSGWEHAMLSVLVCVLTLTVLRNAYEFDGLVLKTFKNS